MNEIKDAFPLCWPFGYKRTVIRKTSAFKQTMDAAQRFLRDEIQRLGGRKLIISTNIPVRNDGGMYSAYMSKKLDDPGVAIYFEYKGKEISMCCDQYERIWENVYALGKGIEALRAMERWGVSDFLDRAFTGFAALPESSATKKWHVVLGISENSTYEEVKRAYHEKAKEHHPDKGGSPERFQEIQAAYLEGMK